MKELNIGTKLFHPCSMDIIEFKVTSIRKYENALNYEAVSIHNVGACGKVEVLIAQDKDDNLRFIGFTENWEADYSRGLDDFVEGMYYSNKEDARLDYYEKQRILVWSSMEEKKRLYEESKRNYERVEKILKTIKESIEEQRKTA